MIKSAMVALLATTAAIVAAPILGQAAEGAKTTMAQAPATAKKSGHIDVNGVNYYYEVQGTGEPLLLLHGGLGSTDMFAPVMPTLTEGRQVIAVDLTIVLFFAGSGIGLTLAGITRP